MSESVTNSAVLAGSIQGLGQLLTEKLAPALVEQEEALTTYLERAQQARAHLRTQFDEAKARLGESLEFALNAIQTVPVAFDSTVAPLSETTGDVLKQSSPKFVAVTDRIGEVHDGFESTKQVLDSSSTQNVSAAEQLNGLTRQILADLAKQCELLRAAADQPQQTLTQARSALESSTGALSQQWAGFLEGHKSELSKLVASLAEKIKASQEQLDQHRNGVNQKAQSGLEQSQEQLVKLGGIASDIHTVFAGKSSHILSDVQGLLKLVDEIKPLIDLVKKF
jgi:hypothetical protein